MTLAPTAALAADYPIQTPVMVCDAATFVPGQVITCQLTGPNGTVIDFKVNLGGGVLSETKTLGQTPTTFSFTVPGGIDEDVTAEAAVDGDVVDTATFTPAAVTTTEVLSAGPVTTDVQTASAPLASTGFEGTAMAVGGGLLLAGGVVSVAIATRRTASRTSV
ncbi:hypothetical protein [Demequina zhanjiangensis]|uniref:DUF4333 domain-containing protein n=1 Tax=Demequina zhanjiangensis TaxID=3051659 RepID=A0ABT8FYR7_9MICO|nr:hypothetical protein [Demequina sp. SYSU T00b26]MDN4472048.1 hypothetical protein [Demequina sp. SYSU T00b26]